MANPGHPGEILNLTKAGLWVTCGDGALLITLIQLPLGKGKVLNGQDILSARKDLLSPGKRFSAAT